jgi:hypothetical protein
MIDDAKEHEHLRPSGKSSVTFGHTLQERIETGILNAIPCELQKCGCLLGIGLTAAFAAGCVRQSDPDFLLLRLLPLR